MKTKIIVLFCVMSFILTCQAFAGDEERRKPFDISRRMIDIERALPSVSLDSLHSDANRTPGFGFSEVVSNRNTAFRIGAFMADFAAAVKSKEREKTSHIIDALLIECSRLTVKEPLSKSLKKLQAAIDSGTDLDALNNTGLIVVRPFIEDVLVKENTITYLFFGEWIELARIILSQNKEKIEFKKEFLSSHNYAGYFTEALKNEDLPKGTTDGLTELSVIEGKAEISLNDIRKAEEIVNTVLMVF
jgi:hypothetical protein